MESFLSKLPGQSGFTAVYNFTKETENEFKKQQQQ
jgi:hypothetical protein